MQRFFDPFFYPRMLFYPRRLSYPGRLLLATTIALAAGSAAMACTPTPCIEASPNPVILGNGQTEGPTNLDWNAGLVPGGVETTVEVDAMETTLSTMPVGQGPYTIEIGKQYLFRIRDSNKVQLASVAVSAERRPVAGRVPDHGFTRIPSEPGRFAAAVNPIEGLFSVHGTFFEFNVRVKEPRNITAFVTRNQPNGCNTDGLDIVTVGAQGTKNYQLQHSLKLYNLEPSTNYFWLIKMTNKAGESVCRDGSFRTKARLSTITVQSVHVFDDSDETSAGDLRFGFFVNPTFDSNQGDPVAFFPSTGETSINSGTGVDFEPDVKLVVPNLEDIDFNVTGSDDDEYVGLGLNTCGQLMIPRNSSASNDCGDYNGKTVPLHFGPEAPGQEEISRNFRVRVLRGALEFEVTCHLQVTYN
ncbi:MAG: hypothetical protein K8J08_14585 [Thermoanaerobaculia bacterium]|nr:hypothetical protein [Thermoanaerobaculia bacterium]